MFMSKKKQVSLNTGKRSKCTVSRLLRLPTWKANFRQDLNFLMKKIIDLTWKAIFR
jgi:hypothetical protein